MHYLKIFFLAQYEVEVYTNAFLMLFLMPIQTLLPPQKFQQNMESSYLDNKCKSKKEKGVG